MSNPTQIPGFWHCPTFQQSYLTQAVKISYLEADLGNVYCLETRSEERGRSVIIETITEKECHEKKYNIKTRVNEYGGKCYTINNNLLVFFDLVTLTLYSKDLSQTAAAPLFHKKGCHFADLILDPDNLFVYAVMEDTNKKDSPAFLIRINLATKTLEILHATQDFYAQPKISSCGTQLAFISWNHPHMPWEENILWKASINKHHVTEPHILCHRQDVSFDQITFSSEGLLYFCCDEDGYSNLYTFENSLQQLTFETINFGVNHWVYGTRRLTFIDANHLIMIGTNKAIDALYLFDCKKSSLKKLQTPFSSISEIASSKGSLFLIGSSVTSACGLHKMTSISSEPTQLNLLESCAVDPCYISHPKTIKISSSAYDLQGFYYPPQNPAYFLKEPPPVIIKIHSGPTSHATPRYQPDVYFFTSKGFAYFELNYRGSSGYSKQFQNLLKGHWGKYDHEDVISSANFLINNKLAHQSLVFLKGSSAGGLTLLNAISQTSMFAGASCYYGVSDLSSLAHHTHKFEKHSLDSLVAPFQTCPEIFHVRSPINHLDKISTPLLLFHGEKDPVVPLEQTINVYEKLKDQGNFVECMIFSDEGHGFKIAKTLQTCLDKELAFYQCCINFLLRNKDFKK